MTPNFSEEQIQSLFGDEAADYEEIKRLRTYYLKTSVYDQFRANLPLRILVGYKGIGKSALFRVAMSEDSDANILAVLIRPDDISEIGGDASDFLKLIRVWRTGLTEIIAQKALTTVGGNTTGTAAVAASFGGRVLEFLRSSFQGSETVSFDPAKKLRVATNNYRVNGGGGYTMFKDCPVVMRSSTEIRDLIIDWVEQGGKIPTEPTGNWRLVTE